MGIKQSFSVFFCQSKSRFSQRSLQLNLVHCRQEASGEDWSPRPPIVTAGQPWWQAHPYTDICLATADLLFIGGGWTGGGERPVSWEQEGLRLFPYSPATRTNRRRPSSPLSDDDRRRPPPPNAAAAVHPTGDGRQLLRVLRTPHTQRRRIYTIVYS